MNKTTLITALMLSTLAAAQTPSASTPATGVATSAAAGAPTIKVGSNASDLNKLPNTAPYNKKVTLSAPVQGVTLEAALLSLSRSVGLSPVIRDMPNVTVRASFKDQSFREVLHTLVLTYGEGKVAYQLLPGDMLLIASPDAIARVAGLQTQNGAPAADEELRFYNSVIDPSRMATVLNNLYPDIKRGAVIDNTLAVIATAAQHEKLGKLVETVNRQAAQQVLSQQLPAGGTDAATAVEVRPYVITTDAETMTRIITTYVPSAKATAVSGARVVLVSATAADHDKLDTALKELSALNPSGTVIRSYNLTGPRSTVEGTLKIFVPGAKISFTSKGDAVIVDASEADQARVREVLGNLSEPVAPRVQEAQEATYQLLGNPAEIIGTIEQFLPGVQARALPSQNLLVVRATPEDQVRLVRLLNQINVTPSNELGEGGVAQRVFTLNYATAEQIGAQLEKLLSVQPSVTVDRNAADVATSAEGAATSAGTTSPVVVPPQSKDAPATPQASSAAGTGAAGAGGTSRKASTNTLLVSSAGPVGSAFQDASPAIRIVAEPRSNSLIVMGTPRQLQLVATTIAALDVPVRQVRLNVRIEQIVNNDASKLGVNWSAGAYGVQIGGGSDGLSVGYTLGSTGLANLNVKLDALQREGKGKTITNSTMLVTDNSAANLASGGELRVKTSTTSTDSNGNSKVSSQFEVFNYGLKLNFVPRISRDGNVEMRVDTAIDSKPNGDFNTYFTIDGRKISTVVNIASGQTVVLGGIITDEESQTKQGVPVVSKIPVIGGLFSKTENQSEQSTLLLIITPEVVDNTGKPVNFGTLVPGSTLQTVPVGR